MGAMRNACLPPKWRYTPPLPLLCVTGPNVFLPLDRSGATVGAAR